MKWLKEYQKHEVCLVGDDELTTGRSWQIQMLYEFGIRSTSLPDIKDPNMTPEYISESSSLSFDVPSCPKNKRLKGLNVAFKYSISGDDWAWFCKVSTANSDLDLMYNPKVFGKPEFGESCIWLSYWPIGNKLDTGDTLNVSIVVMSGLEVHKCGVSLVYSDQGTLENNMGWAEVLGGGDLSGFQLSTGSYYLCRRDFFELSGVKRLTPDWFRILVGDTIDYTEVRGWRKTGRPKHVNPSFTELKIVRCIIHGPQLEDIYKIAEMSKSDPYSHGRIMNSATGEGENSSSSTSALPCHRFSLAEIKSATKNFDDEGLIEHDWYGSVYKGQITSEEGGHVVAIKRLDPMFNQGALEFRAKIDMLSTLRHCHLVSVIGYCHENREKILVYEYIPNGSLYHHLHEANTPLSWLTRLKIAIGAARGLDYLHTGAGVQRGVIHRDMIRSSSILLDENWAAMISGFGFKNLSTNQLFTGVEGTSALQVTREIEVYAFGVVLFELLSRRPAVYIDKEGYPFSLVSWAKKCVEERKLDQMVDPDMKGTISTECLRGFTQIADRCLQILSEHRPTMSEIVASLEALLELQEKSNRSAKRSVIPGFAWKLIKYFVPATKPTSDKTGTSSKKSLGKKKKDEHDE